MRLALLALAALTVAGCDSTTSEERPPETEFVGVTVAYRVSVVGESFDVAVTYTGADGEVRNEAVDFSRGTSYGQDVTLDPGTSGTFTLSATGLIDDGRLAASIVVTRDDTGDEVASDADVITTTGAGEEASVTARVDVPEVVVTPGSG
ncbi:hypothetical protein [Rubrivirga sp.]|uniref:hypothetical protein n=1 Tax=Rubrivirga sp. TaxID=1885344 RepID=UPI003B52CCEB